MGWGPKAPDMSGANEAARTGAAISKEEWDYYQKEIAPRALQQMDDQIQIGGQQWADECAPGFWRAMTQEHSFEEFLAECGRA